MERGRYENLKMRRENKERGRNRENINKKSDKTRKREKRR